MLVFRWQAPTPPSVEQITMILFSEGLEAKEETIEKQQKNIEKRHPFSEVRMVAGGEILVNIAGTQLLLRAGDRIEIPANTRHSITAQNDTALTIYAHRPY